MVIDTPKIVKKVEEINNPESPESIVKKLEQDEHEKLKYLIKKIPHKLNYEKEVKEFLTENAGSIMEVIEYYRISTDYEEVDEKYRQEVICLKVFFEKCGMTIEEFCKNILKETHIYFQKMMNFFIKLNIMYAFELFFFEDKEWKILGKVYGIPLITLSAFLKKLSNIVNVLTEKQMELKEEVDEILKEDFSKKSALQKERITNKHIASSQIEFEKSQNSFYIGDKVASKLTQNEFDFYNHVATQRQIPFITENNTIYKFEGISKVVKGKATGRYIILLPNGRSETQVFNNEVAYQGLVKFRSDSATKDLTVYYRMACMNIVRPGINDTVDEVIFIPDSGEQIKFTNSSDFSYFQQAIDLNLKITKPSKLTPPVEKTEKRDLVLMFTDSSEYVKNEFVKKFEKYYDIVIVSINCMNYDSNVKFIGFDHVWIVLDSGYTSKVSSVIKKCLVNRIRFYLNICVFDENWKYIRDYIEKYNHKSMDKIFGWFEFHICERHDPVHGEIERYMIAIKAGNKLKSLHPIIDANSFLETLEK